MHGDLPHEQLLDLFNSVSEGVVAVDRDSRVTLANRAALQMLGLSLPDVQGRPVGEILVTDLGRGRCVLGETLRTREPLVERDLVLEDSRGRQLPVILTTSLTTDRRGEVVGAAATFRSLVKVRQMLASVDRSRPFLDIVTGDPAMRRLIGTLPTIARADSSLMILGETGTGKSLLVRTIHTLSPRHRGPLVTLNCAALPETLIESELFGVAAGAYTGATRDRAGRLEAAEGGTLFLDEIGDISPAVQVKLLRVLQERAYERLGDVRPRACDVRFIAATHRDLDAMVECGEFRRDLYYRINVLNLTVPPLRHRKGDIPLLAQRFLDRLSQDRGKPVTGISSRVLEILTAHDYPGNIRELENIIEHAFVMCRGDVLEPAHLPRELAGDAAPSAPRAAAAAGLPRLEAEYIRQVLVRHGGHREAAARELGIHRTTLQRKIRRLGVAVPEGDGRSSTRTQ